MAKFSPDYFSYHQSLSNELQATKGRIRNLVPHRLSDGVFKEAILRSVLRRHLPKSLLIGKGFVVTKRRSSTECDLLIVDASKPILFNDGDMVIVTPDAVAALISVKTTLRGEANITKALTALAKQKKLCHAEETNTHAWAGLFVYSATARQASNLLKSLNSAHELTGTAIDCVAFGPTVLPGFIRRFQRTSTAESRKAEVQRQQADGLFGAYLG